MHRIFISDLHLDDPQSNAFQRFAECLATESAQNDEIYILGDLVEMWIGDDDDSECAVHLKAALRSASQCCDVLLMHGNRDFLFGPAFAESTGVRLIEDPTCTADGLLLSHGDSLCTDDEVYQQMRSTLRSEAWQTDILAKSLAERKAFGQALRQQSQSSNANKPANIMDVNLDATRTLIEKHGSHTLVHGHTHRAGVHTDQGYTRVVMGAWERCGWLCRQQQDVLSLECFSLARRYGT